MRRNWRRPSDENTDSDTARSLTITEGAARYPSISVKEPGLYRSERIMLDGTEEATQLAPPDLAGSRHGIVGHGCRAGAGVRPLDAQETIRWRDHTVRSSAVFV